MAHKVKICGLDTSSLPKLKEKQMKELMLLVKAGDNEARNQFIMCNIRLVLSVLQRFWNIKQNPDDVFQVGVIGLIKAIDNFDVSLDVKFSTYAVPMIIGEIRRFLRDSNSMHVSRSLRDTAYKVLQMREQMSLNSEMDEPNLTEIAKNLGLSVREVTEALDAVSEPVSLFDPVYSQGEDTMLLMDKIKDNKNTSDNWLENIALNEAITRLGEREKNILYLRYYQGKTQMEVSNEVGISQAQVSRLEKNAIKSVKKYIG